MTDQHPFNLRRADRAHKATLAYINTGMDSSVQALAIDNPDALQESLTDLVSDIFHLCDTMGIDGDVLMTRARHHHRHEVLPDEHELAHRANERCANCPDMKYVGSELSDPINDILHVCSCCQSKRYGCEVTADDTACEYFGS